MELSTQEISALLQAQGFDEARLAPQQRRIIAEQLLYSAEFGVYFDQFLRRKFGVEILQAMYPGVKERISDRLWPKWKVKPTIWVVDLYNAVTGVPCVKAKCHQCDAVDCWVPPNKGLNTPPARWTDRGPVHAAPFVGTIELALQWARDSRFRHCGKEEAAPDQILNEYERRLQTHLPPTTKTPVPGND